MFKINNMRQIDYEKIDDLENKLRRDPDNLDLLSQKAFIYFLGYDDKNVIKIYDKIIQLYPDSIDAYMWLSYYFYQAMSDSFESIDIAKKGLTIDPKNAALHLIIAWALDSLDEDNDEFKYNLQKAIEIEPTWITPRITFIDYLIRQKKYQEAKDEINIAIKYFDPNFAVPKDPIKYQYEFYITGRADHSNKEMLENLFNNLRKNHE